MNTGWRLRLGVGLAAPHGARELAWVYTVETTGIKRCRIVSGRWPE